MNACRPVFLAGSPARTAWVHGFSGRPGICGLIVCAALVTGCDRPTSAPSHHHHHRHEAPHGGLTVSLPGGQYELEYVQDLATGTLRVYVLDHCLENFVPATTPQLEIAARPEGREETLVLRAADDEAAGETVGNTARFEARAEWLKDVIAWEGTLREITIRGRTFTDVPVRVMADVPAPGAP